MPYFFIIPNKKLKIYFMLALGIIILNLIGLALLMVANTAANRGSNFIRLTGAAIVIAGVLAQSGPRRRMGMAGTVILLIGIFWMAKGYTEVFFANLILWLLYSVSRRVLLVGVDEQAVAYPSFPKKEIPWAQLNQVILKDDILTIDLKNNKIYQHLIEYADNPVNEEEFNEFCRTQLRGSQ